MTKTQAIKYARDHVSMFRFGGGWKISVFDSSVNARREGQPGDYYKQLCCAGESKIALALEQMGKDESEIYFSQSRYRDAFQFGANWVDFL